MEEPPIRAQPATRDPPTLPATLAALPGGAVSGLWSRVRAWGRWPGECSLSFGRGRPAVPPGDAPGFRSAVRRHYGHTALPKAADLRALAEPWRPYRSFATWY